MPSMILAGAVVFSYAPTRLMIPQHLMELALELHIGSQYSTVNAL